MREQPPATVFFVILDNDNPGKDTVLLHLSRSLSNATSSSLSVLPRGACDFPPSPPQNHLLLPLALSSLDSPPPSWSPPSTPADVGRPQSLLLGKTAPPFPASAKSHVNSCRMWISSWCKEGGGVSQDLPSWNDSFPPTQRQLSHIPTVVTCGSLAGAKRGGVPLKISPLGMTAPPPPSAGKSYILTVVACGSLAGGRRGGCLSGPPLEKTGSLT